MHIQLNSFSKCYDFLINKKFNVSEKYFKELQYASEQLLCCPLQNFEINDK